MTPKEQARRDESARLRDEAEFQHHRMKRILHEIDVALFGPEPLGYEPDRVKAINSRELLRLEVTQERDEALAQARAISDESDHLSDLLDHARDERDDLIEALKLEGEWGLTAQKERDQLRQQLAEAKKELRNIRSGQTVTVEYDLSPTQVEGKLREKLQELGWVPPEHSASHSWSEATADLRQKLAASQQREADAIAHANKHTELSVAAMHIAEGEEGWQKVRNECPMLVAVAELRDKYEAAQQREAELAAACKVYRDALEETESYCDDFADGTPDSPGFARRADQLQGRIGKALALQSHDAPRPLLE